MQFFVLPTLKGFSALTILEYFVQYKAQGKFLQPNGVQVLVSVELVSTEE